MRYESDLKFLKYKERLAVAISLSERKYAILLSRILLGLYPDSIEIRELSRSVRENTFNRYLKKSLLFIYYPLFIWSFYRCSKFSTDLAERIVYSYSDHAWSHVLLAKSSRLFAYNETLLYSLEKATKCAPESIPVLLDLAKVYLEQGDSMKSKEVIGEVYRLNPGNYTAMTIEKQIVVFESLKDK